MKYLSEAARNRATAERIARHELSIHEVEMTIVENGCDRNIVLQGGKTAEETIKAITETINALEAAYAVSPEVIVDEGEVDVIED